MIIAIIVFLFNISCIQKDTANFIEIGKSTVKYNSVNEYFSKSNGSIENQKWIEFMFLNNPYNLNENNIISIYINHKLVFRGVYKKHIDLQGDPNEIFLKDKRMIVSMEILTDKTKKVIWEHRFQNKTVFSWNKDYKIIYCAFLPTNENVENVSFIPQFEVKI